MTDLLRAAETAGRAAAALLRARPTRVAHKGAIDLVTEVDLASERCIREHLAATGLPIQGEEGGGVTTGTRWVVDPLDGTTNFVHGYAPYVVSIGLCEGDEPVLGCIVDPVRDRVFLGAKGHGATVDGAPLRVSDVRSLDRAVAVTGFPNNNRAVGEANLAWCARVIRSTQGLRRSGSAAYDLTSVASGSLEVFWEHLLHPWDTAAGVLLVREAGGTVTRVDGRAWTPGSPHVLATNGWLHDAVVRLFEGLEVTWA